MGVRHSNFQLEQWLLDETLNARLNDFNASKYNRNIKINLKSSEVIKAENISYFIPRYHVNNSTIKSNLFALRSTLYKLVVDKASYDDRFFKSIENLFREGVFSDLNRLSLDDLITSY